MQCRDDGGRRQVLAAGQVHAGDAAANPRHMQRKAALIGADVQRLAARIAGCRRIVLPLIQERAGLLPGLGVHVGPERLRRGVLHDRRQLRLVGQGDAGRVGRRYDDQAVGRRGPLPAIALAARNLPGSISSGRPPIAL